MIKNSEPISMTEAQKYIDAKSEQGAKALEFIKKFSKLNAKDSEKMKEELTNLENVKLNSANIAKIIEILPETSEEVSKIFTDVHLDEDETKKVIDIVKQFK
jgi:DNA-directed RNA polymerase subunit F